MTYNFSLHKCIASTDEQCKDNDNTNTSCVIYDGDDLPCLDIKKGDRMNNVLSKIDDSFCQILERMKGIDFTNIIDCNTLKE